MDITVAPAARGHASVAPLASRVVKSAPWFAVVAVAFWYIRRNALGYLIPQSTERAAYVALGVQGSVIVLHVTTGMLALLLGPLQFIKRFRQARPRLHRTIGRVYLASVAVGATTAIYLLMRLQRGLAYETGLYGLAVAWLVTAGMALAAVRLGQFEQHREWMIRSYVVTFAFVSIRIGNAVMITWGIGDAVGRNGTLAWLCWALPLLVTEVLLQGRKLVAVARAQRQRKAAAAYATAMQNAGSPP
jgi:uncharacterized membrane protein